MRTTCGRFALLATMLVLGGAMARADWFSGNPAKWVQLPDLTPGGMDVLASAPAILADDFPCTTTGPITGIHVWASWKTDMLPLGSPSNVIFTLSLHGDIPATFNTFSRPGPVLWMRSFPPGTFEVRTEAIGLVEGWYAPSEGQYLPFGDTVCYQYNFPISTNDAFLQTGTTQRPLVYWLDVQALPLEPTASLGWKTTLNHWNDDAVWGLGSEPFQGSWSEMRYPTGHPLQGQSVDLAFAIVTATNAGPYKDWGDAPDPKYPTLATNNGANHIIGGPWLGPDDDAPDAEADGQPDANAFGDDMNGTAPDDEDGVWIPAVGTRLVQGLGTTLKLIVNGSPTPNWVDGWIDWNGDGDWADAGEHVVSGTFTNGTYYPPITPPTNAAVGSTFARFRISSQQGLSWYGPALDGEVEDHAVLIRGSDIPWCDLQWPPATTTTVGVATENIYGQIWIPGDTDPPGQAEGIFAQLGYGPRGTDPNGNPLWVWTNAVYNTDVGNNDEYMAQIVPASPGTYDYAYRFTRNFLAWTYADYNPGTADGYSTNDAGRLTVLGGVTAECEKWIQGPDCNYGIDLPSYALQQQEPPPYQPVFRVADDWLCDGRPIAAIAWWGSYVGWPSPVPPPVSQGRPVGFRVRWYTDIPAVAGQTAYSRPGFELTNLLVTLLPFGDTGAGGPGSVKETFYCTVTNKLTAPGYEHEYEYRLDLPEPWLEKPGQVYWLSIEAVVDKTQMPPGYDPVKWGWKTSAETNLIDDAVVWQALVNPGMPLWEELSWPTYPWPYLFNDSKYPGYGPFISALPRPSVNMAFVLFTDVCPRRTWKYRQPPNMADGTDVWSWRHEPPQQGYNYRLLADDFISDGRRISDVHWWGSYSNWQSAVDGGVTNPVPPPTGYNRPVGFVLSWHADNPTNSCLPGAPLREVFVAITNCHEMYYGTVTQTWWHAYEHEYQYYVDLLAVDQPWNEVKDGHYWLNIQAIFDPRFIPEPQGGHGGWGWKITPWNNNICQAAVSNAVAPLGWQRAYLPPDYAPRPGQTFDLAFELTTDEVPSNPPPGTIVITNVLPTNAVSGDTVISVGTTGAGTQVLQNRTNMLTGVWSDILTNPAPFPPPWPNAWNRPGPVKSNEFYRVIER